MTWFPWSWIVRHAARSFGIGDPALLMARVRRFGRPSKHDIPVEIIRNAILLHSRGLINTRAIQHNLDWIWPYWIQRQFDPRDVSFLPRSANFSHINLTHRNWTAVGLPDLAVYPLVDPRGLVTPLHDGWSIDAWLISASGAALFPSQTLDGASQTLDSADQSITTRVERDTLNLTTRVWAEVVVDEPVLRILYKAAAPPSAQLVVSVRPYNCEGVQFVDSIAMLPEGRGWAVNESQNVYFSRAPNRVSLSTYVQGDVVHRLSQPASDFVKCSVGMATGAACFELDETGHLNVEVSVPLASEARRMHQHWRRSTWSEAQTGFSELSVPDSHYEQLFKAARNTILHLTADEAYPGPYTYRRFWFRDASLMVEALVEMGKAARARRHLDRFVRRQRRDGYFESQEGEWDANGEVLWAMGRYLQLTGEPLADAWHRAILKAARWLANNRLPDDGSAHGGLLPAGFSAEHFGPNDHYYWDVFWAIGGLRSIAAALARAHHENDAKACSALADRFLGSAEQSIQTFAIERANGAIPASPYRRMDSGAVGVLVADYPLQIFRVGDQRIANTLDYFLSHNFVHGGFFQDMTHSGVNVYLTLAIAQSLLRAGNPAWESILSAVQRSASTTGMWPEAIHPLTFGGCIGDGQHGWAAAEWLRWTRNAFLREEGDALVFGSGLLREWRHARAQLRFGPSLTPWGAVSATLQPLDSERWSLNVDARWRGAPPKMIVAIPGTKAQMFAGREITVHLAEEETA